MHQFTLTIDTDGAAFADGDDCLEVARILSEIVAKLEQMQDGGQCFDINGNYVGCWALGEEQSA